MLSKASLVSRKKFRKNLEIKSPKFWPWELVATVYRLPLSEPSPDPLQQQPKEDHCTDSDDKRYRIGQSVTHGPIIPPQECPAVAQRLRYFLVANLGRSVILLKQFGCMLKAVQQILAAASGTGRTVYFSFDRVTQIFIAEVTKLIDQIAFERSWKNDPAIDGHFQVTFAFAGQRISATVECSQDRRWQSDSFHRAFSNAVRRVDGSCNVRWL
jgi:hypothetical protein